MKPASKLFSKLLLVVVPLTAASVLPTLPSYAATLTTSRTTTFISNFSPFAFDLGAAADTDTLTIATGLGEATATANADSFLLPIFGASISESSASGTGFNYLGFARSEAAVTGSFNVQRVFSFNFLSQFTLSASIDNPALEAAFASTRIGFNLFSVGDGTEELLDSFSFGNSLELFGQSGSSNAPALTILQPSDNVSFLPFTSLQTNGNQSIASALLLGQYSRTFDAPVTLRLEQFQINETAVQAVPTPSLLPGLLFNFVLLPLMRRKRKKSEQLATQPVEVQNEFHPLEMR